MVDLATTYMGLALENPLVASASPFSKRVDLVRDLQKAGAGAVVMYSLFEEQISYEVKELNPHLNPNPANYTEAINYYPQLRYYNLNPDEYIQHLYLVKKAVNIPVIGSINGVSTGGWLEYAYHMQQAGADGLELNIYFLATDQDLTGAELEETYIRLVQNLKDRLNIPFALKLHPFFSSLPNMAKRLVGAGAKGLVFFNRFYQPDLDLEKLIVVPNLDLSTSRDLRLPLRWIAILYGRLPVDFALSGGIHTAQDVLKGIAAGASVTMLTSELIEKGIGRLSEIKADLAGWLEAHNYQSLKELRGRLSQQAITETAAFERANYLKILNSLP